MALETLKGVTELGGFPVIIMDELREEALRWLEARTKDREKRGVEGTNNA